jgi:flagellar hook assembly protein FlgD
LDPYPNPFNGYIQIPIILKNINSEKVYISNIKGEIIKEISIKHLNPGLNNLIWDGTNQRGFNISTGIYFINLKSSKRIDIQKIIYLK